MTVSKERIFIAGHNGMVGRAVFRQLEKCSQAEMVFASRKHLDLTEQAAVRDFLAAEKPTSVIVAAAKVGGILANSRYPAQFASENLLIASNLITESFQAGITRLIFLGSSCIYPREASQPIPEEALLTGPLETTNEAYAMAKIAGMKLCQFYRQQYGVDYFSLMPCNLYGPGDNYDLQNSHVLPALIRRFHEAKENGQAKVTLWGSGRPLREFLHTEDLARAIVHTLKQPPDEHWLNVGSGQEISIADLAKMVADVVGYGGKVEYDSTKPDGTLRKLMDSTKIRQAGWIPQISLPEGIVRTYQDFLRERESGRL